MAASLLLVGWCAGLCAGYLGLLKVPAGLGVAASVTLAAVAALVWLSARPAQDAAPRSALVPILVPLIGSLAILGVVRGEAGRPPAGPGSVAAYVGRTVTLTGRVDSAGLAAAGSTNNPAARLQSFHVVVTEVDAAGRRAAPAGAILVRARGHAEVFDGQRVAVRGNLFRPRQLGPGGASGYADRLQRQGVVAEMSAGSVTPLDPPPALGAARVASTARRGLVAAIRDALPEPEATVVLGEVAGIRGALPAGVDTDLVQSGLVHILAISGIKVAIVAGLLQAVAVPLFGRRGALLSIVGVGFYTVVGGATASALRSALMGSLGLVGAAVRRDTDVVRSLLLAASAMLGHRPGLVLDLSFQYSFLGVLGIHLFADPISRRAMLVPRPFRDALAVTLAAQIGTLPLTAHYFAVVPLLSPLANAAVLPTLPLAILGGLAIAALHAAAGLVPGEAWSRLLGAASLPLSALVFALARLALVVAHLTRSIPGSAISAPGFGAPAAVAYYAATAIVVAGQSRRWPALRMAGLAAATAMVALLLMGRPDGRLHVVFLGGVTGPAAVVVAPDGATLLVDTGSSAASLTPALDETLPPSAPLPGVPRRLDALALTGSAREEAGGLAALGSRRVSVAVGPDGMTGGAAVSALARLRADGAGAIRLRPGDHVPWHGIELTADAGGAAGELALELRLGNARILVVSSADPRAMPVVGPGDYSVVALGGGAADPGLVGVNAGVVLVQNAGGATATSGGASTASAHPVARGLRQAAGERLWETARDGPLRLSCDRGGCTRG